MTIKKNTPIEEQLDMLYKLQLINNKLRYFERLKKKLPEEIIVATEKVNEIDEKIQVIEGEINGMKTFIDETTEKIKEAKQDIKKYEKQTDTIKNTREFEAISKEIEDKQLNVLLHEKQIKDTNIELLAKVKALENWNKVIKHDRALLAKKDEELKEIEKKTKKDEDKLNKEKVELEANFYDKDQSLIGEFNRIKNQYSNRLAIVPIDRDSCGGCFVSIPSQQQIEIKLNKTIIHCESCGRILYDNSTE